MGIGIGQLIIIFLIILVLFGAGKLPSVMSEIGKGIKALRGEIDEKNKKKK